MDRFDYLIENFDISYGQAEAIINYELKNDQMSDVEVERMLFTSMTIEEYREWELDRCPPIPRSIK